MYNSFHVWQAVNQSIKERGTATHIGPYVTMTDLKQLHRTFAVGRLDSEEVKKARAEALKGIYATRKATDANSAKAPLLPELYATASKHLIALQDKEMQQLLEQDKQTIAKKLAKIQTIHNYFVQCIGDSEWNYIIISCDWQAPNSNRYYDPVRYSCGIVQSLMARFISAPSSFTKKAIKSIAGQVQEVFDLISSQNDLFSYSFLSEDSKWENAFRQYAIAELPLAKFMSLSLPRFERSDPDEVQGEVAMLKYLIAQRKFGDAFAHAICTNHDEILEEIFARVVHDVEPPANHTFFVQEDFRDFARSCYRFHEMQQR